MTDFFKDNEQQNFPDFRSILELPSGIGEAAGPTANERFTGQIIVDGEAIPVEAGEALFKGQIYKVGQADSKGNRSVFDGKGKVVGSAGQEGEDMVFRAPTIETENDRIFGTMTRANPTGNFGTGRGGTTVTRANPQPDSQNRRTITRANQGASPYLDNIKALLTGNEFDASALIGGQKKELRDELKAGAIKKLLGFFKGAGT